MAEAVRLEEEGRRRRAARMRLIAERGERQRQAARALWRRERRKEQGTTFFSSRSQNREKSDFCSDSLNQVRARKSSAMIAWRRTPPC